MTDLTDLFGDVIYAYTRKQAIEDGFQMPLTDELTEVGMEDMARQLYKYPIFLTSAVYELIQKAVDNKRWLNDWKGVVWDILYMSQNYKRELSPSKVETKVRINGAGRKKDYWFHLEVGPMDIDNPEPVITIMMADED